MSKIRVIDIQLNRKFREDINGLRALAVILVLLYHLDTNYFERGFLGVDIFFVISGYLISRNILFELKSDDFSFKNFYIKRIRRLFPALLFTLIITLVAAHFFLAESSLNRLGKVSLSAMLSVSNFFFLGEQGYFNAESVYKPLLHTWSLGVEEQFYLIWPALLFLLFKFGTRQMLWMVALLFCLSLFANFRFADEKMSMVFFMLPFRIFEFIFGLLALWVENYFKHKHLFRKILYLIGFLLISAACFGWLEFADVSLINQFLACFGTMLILAFGKTSIKQNRIPILNKVVSQIGSSSYSIYLIHWPLIVFYKMYNIAPLQTWEKMLLFFLSLGLGGLLWRYVENTFRYSDRSPFIRFKWAIPLGVVVVIVLSLLLLNSESSLVSNKSSQKERDVSNKTELTSEDLESEMKRYWKNAEPNSPILKGTSANKVIVMGNSHAVDLIYALRRNGLKADIVSLPTTHLCYHFGGAAILEKDEAKCRKVKNRNLSNDNWASVDAVFLHDHWPVEETDNLKLFISEIRDKTTAPIYIFGPKMVFKSTIPQLVKASGTDDPKAINAFAIKYSDLKKRSSFDRKLDRLIDQSFMKKQNIHYISLMRESGLKEIISTDTKAYYYFDKSHLTELGAIELGRKLKLFHPNLFDY